MESLIHSFFSPFFFQSYNKTSQFSSPKTSWTFRVGGRRVRYSILDLAGKLVNKRKERRRSFCFSEQKILPCSFPPCYLMLTNPQNISNCIFAAPPVFSPVSIFVGKTHRRLTVAIIVRKTCSFGQVEDTYVDLLLLVCILGGKSTALKSIFLLL